MTVQIASQSQYKAMCFTCRPNARCFVSVFVLISILTQNAVFNVILQAPATSTLAFNVFVIAFIA